MSFSINTSSPNLQTISQDHQTPRKNIQSLPDHLILYILENFSELESLKSLARVNHQWNQFTKEHSLIKHVIARDIPNPFPLIRSKRD